MTAAEFIGLEEGFRAKAYQDSAGNWTIGFGRLLTTDQNADPSQWPDVDKTTEAERHFGPDIARFRAGVQRLITIHLSPTQETALVSFAYNLGLGALETSKLRDIINEDVGTRQWWSVRVALEWVDWSQRSPSTAASRRPPGCWTAAAARWPCSLARLYESAKGRPGMSNRSHWWPSRGGSGVSFSGGCRC